MISRILIVILMFVLAHALYNRLQPQESVEPVPIQAESEPHGALQINSDSAAVTRYWEAESGAKTGTFSPTALQKRLEITGAPSPPKEDAFTTSSQSSIRMFSVPTWQCELGHATNFVYRDATSTPERVKHPVHYCLEHLGALLDQFQVPRAALKGRANEQRP